MMCNVAFTWIHHISVLYEVQYNQCKESMGIFLPKQCVINQQGTGSVYNNNNNSLMRRLTHRLIINHAEEGF